MSWKPKKAKNIFLSKIFANFRPVWFGSDLRTCDFHLGRLAPTHASELSVTRPGFLAK